MESITDLFDALVAEGKLPSLVDVDEETIATVRAELEALSN